MDCNGLQWEDSSGITPPPDSICRVRVGCNVLQWEGFWGITPWLKLPCKSVLQWAELGKLFRNYPPWINLPCKSGLQWEDFWVITPWLKLPCKSVVQWAELGKLFRNYPPPHPDSICRVRVGWNVLQWEGFWGITPPPPWVWGITPHGVWVRGQFVQRGVKCAESWAAKGGGGKWCKSEGIICSEGLKKM